MFYVAAPTTGAVKWTENSGRKNTRNIAVVITREISFFSFVILAVLNP